ncbi:glycosyl hydrolase-related protein [Terriglobus roseus]|uniref:Glycosyl hydrolases family 38 C-terminal domain-containing protein n=1 Tax=Terriglobus roseus TaxID=392734 RepID=A0A1G7GTU8_9BACT|nr:glycosyl hydrolase-related protein [Terriglobus roseus]SDE91369.1 Glycosyl hydrolases family 38 C-terminal domain-containing protein [Terriglobus roseus]
MQRRDVLKGFTAAMGSALITQQGWARGLEQSAPPIAVPIRGYVRKNSKLMQPVRITLPSARAGAEVVVKIDGEEHDRRKLASADQAFEIFVEPVSKPQRTRVSLTIDGVEHAAEIERKPVRQMKVYVLPHSHHDLGYTDLQAAVEEKQINNIVQGIELARKTSEYPEGSRFVWNLEVLWGADLFMKRRSASDRTALIDAIKKGWIALNGSYANELTGLCRPEELVELFRFGTQLGKACGVPVRSAMMSDVPGFSWGTVTAMAQAGIRYFSAAPNYFDRIGTFMVEWQDKPFWWVSPSGKERILFWVPWTGYAMSHVMKLGDEWVDKYQDRMDEVGFPYDISCIRWSGHGDNAVPDPELSPWIKRWNETYEWPKFHISSTETAFSAFEKAYGDKLPEHRGDLTPYWEDGAASSALETAMSRNAAERITQAAALAAAFHPESYAPDKYNEAWRNVLLYSEHTWGAYCSVSDSENPFTLKQWAVKRAFAVDAAKDADTLLADALGSGSTTTSAAEVDVYNATSWSRSEVVLLTKEQSHAGDHVENAHGQAVPSQRLASGELALWVESIAPYTKRRFRLSSKKPARPAHAVSVRGDVLENEKLRVKLHPDTGDIVELMQHGDAANLVDTKNGAANQFLFMAGNDTERLGHSGKATITVEDPGPLVATVLIRTTAPSCNGLTRRVRLVAGMDFVALENTVDKQRAALNPNPGKGGQGGEFAQRGSKESIQFGFPMQVPDGKMTLDVPLAVMQPEVDQLSGSCKNWLPVGRWVDLSSQVRGVTWATLDAPLLEVGGITATMLGSQKNPAVWRKHIEATQTFYSWVMNNHWGTNYRAYQQGPVTFRYALRPHRGNSSSETERFATGLTQPLIAAPASGSASASEPMLHVSPQEVLVQSLKPSDDGKAWIVRLFCSSGEKQQATLTWADRAHAGKTWISNLSEETVQAVDASIPIYGWQLVTIRVERNV